MSSPDPVRALKPYLRHADRCPAAFRIVLSVEDRADGWETTESPCACGLDVAVASALAAPPVPPEREDPRFEIARLLTGRCTNCFVTLPGAVGCSVRSAGWNWISSNLGPFCDECMRESSAPPVPQAPETAAQSALNKSAGNFNETSAIKIESRSPHGDGQGRPAGSTPADSHQPSASPVPAETEPPPPRNEAELVRAFADQILPEIRHVAKELGYAIAVHGSLARDIDLVAVPWSAIASAPEVLVASVITQVKAVTGKRVWVPETVTRHDGGARVKNPECKPHGRIGWSIYLGGGPGYIDLSVCRPSAPPVASPAVETGMCIADYDVAMSIIDEMLTSQKAWMSARMLEIDLRRALAALASPAETEKG